MPDEPPAPSGAHIAQQGKATRFNSDTGRAARTKVLKEQREEATAKAKQFHAANQLAKRLSEHLKREDLADKAFAAAQKIVNDLLTGVIPVRNATEAANAIKAMVDVGRAEKGEADAALSGLSREEMLKSVMAIRDMAADRTRELKLMQGGQS